MSNIKIGRRIREAREKNGMSQKELANSIGCCTQHISVMERDIRSPRLDTLVKIINILHIEPNVLFQDTINLSIDSTYDKEFSLITGWLSNEDKKMILKIVKTLSGDLYERKLRNEK